MKKIINKNERKAMKNDRRKTDHTSTHVLKFAGI